MPKVDQFESVFRAADKAQFRYERAEIGHVLFATDLEGDEAEAFVRRVRRFLSVLGDEVRYTLVPTEEVRSLERLLAVVTGERPDLIVTYRNLFSQAWRWPYSLGPHVDVLTQVVEPPVLVLPHPKAGEEFAHALTNTDRVMAITGRLTGADRLVNLAVLFTQEKGTLILAHVEDDGAYARFVAAISKVPSIDTDDAREKILAQLLKEPADYIETCRAALAAAGVPIATEALVTSGHRVREIRRVVAEREVDLLLMPTKDQDQLAMHGLSYPLAVEMREIPILLI